MQVDQGLEDEEPAFIVTAAGGRSPALLHLVAPLLSEGTLVLRDFDFGGDGGTVLPPALSQLSPKVTALVIRSDDVPNDGCKRLFERLPSHVVRVVIQPPARYTMLPPRMARKVYLRPG